MAKNDLKDLDYRHLAAARLKVAGHSTDYICGQLGVARATVIKWWSDPLMRAELDRLSAEVQGKFVERLVEASTRAIASLEELIEMPIDKSTVSASQRREAAEALLDRLPQTSRIADRQLAINSTEGQQNIMNVFVEKTDEELMALVRAGADQLEQQGTITGTLAS